MVSGLLHNSKLGPLGPPRKSKNSQPRSMETAKTHAPRCGAGCSSSSNRETQASYPDKVLGCILGAMCGDALGCSVEGWDPQRIARQHRSGLTTYQQSDRGLGCYTDDSQMLLALAASLVNQRGRCSEADAASHYAHAFDPRRGYGGSAVKILLRLQQGADPTTTGTQFMPGGSFGNGGAMRIAPLGLALRNAPLEQLQQGVVAALLCTHVHPVGVEGALTMAAAVAEASRADPAAADAAGVRGGVALLQLLQERLAGAISAEMSRKLDLLRHAALEQMPGFKPPDRGWAQHLASPAWAAELSTAGQVAPGFQIRATDAVAAALWAAVAHWTRPADAVVAAVHYGGDTDTLACMTGALMGALHGAAWIPAVWLEQLENSGSPPAEPGQPASFFDRARLARTLAAGDLAAASCDDGDDAGGPGSGGSGGGGEALVLTTRDMGRDAAVQLAALLALVG